MLPEWIFHPESNGDGPVTVRSRESVKNGHKTSYAHKWSFLKVVIDKTWDMLPEWIFHPESNGGGPVAVQGRESVQNGRQTQFKGQKSNILTLRCQKWPLDIF